MNTTSVLISIFVLLVLGGGIWAMTHRGTLDEAMDKQGLETMPHDVDATKDSATKTEEGSVNDGDPDSIMAHGSYETYAPEKIAQTTTSTVLFFRASWCPTCRALDADIRAHLETIPADVTILDVDYDTSSALKQKYGVTMQHTLVQVAADGTLVKKWTGSQTLMDLLAHLP